MKFLGVILLAFLLGCKDKFVRSNGQEILSVEGQEDLIDKCRQVEIYRKKGEKSIKKITRLLDELQYEFAQAQKTNDYGFVDEIILELGSEQDRLQRYFPPVFTIPTKRVQYTWAVSREEVEDSFKNQLPLNHISLTNLRATIGKNSSEILPKPEMQMSDEVWTFTVQRQASWTDICCIKYKVAVRGDLQLVDKYSETHSIPLELWYNP